MANFQSHDLLSFEFLFLMHFTEESNGKENHKGNANDNKIAF